MMDKRLQQEVEQQFGRAIPSKIWDHLQKRGSFGDGIPTGKAWNDLTELIWDLLEIKGELIEKAESSLPRDTPARGDVQAALSLVVARAADRDQESAAFRSEVLNGILLQLEDVQTWINDQQARDGEPTWWLELPLPAGTRVRDTRRGLVAEPAVTVSARSPARIGGVSRRMLWYATATSEWQHCVLVTQGAVLDRLRVLSERLSQANGWQPAQATVFVLTGRAPLIPAVRFNVSAEARGRITMEADPALTPRELADSYRRLRRDVLGTRRVKRLSRKHLELAVFGTSRPDDEPWEDRCAAWNRAYPKLAYPKEKLSYFKRDCEKAQERLTSPRIAVSDILEFMRPKPAVRENEPDAKAKRTRRR